MKKLLLTAVVAFVVASLIATVLSDWLQPPEPPPQPEPLPDALVVLCFHGTTLTGKCKKIEAYTHEVLEKSFAKPLKEEKIVWRVLDYEDPENAQFKEDFGIVTSCIVLADARSNRPGVAKNLQKKGWELVDNEEAFKAFIRTEIEKALK